MQSGTFRGLAPAPVAARARGPQVGQGIVATGVNAKALSTYMGHGSITVTFDRYGHLMPGNEAEAAGLLDAYLTRADTQGRLAQLDPA